ncbi:MAG: hypothetical protein ACLFWM_04900, partial [Actinomycetota bacterium]
MLNSLRQTWSREAVGYRRGELEDGDGVAAMVVTLIGGPALVVGAMLVTVGELSLGQVLLVAPVGALLGAVLVGSSATMAAQTGANGTWLMRPAFGRGGSVVVSVLRLVMVGAWAVVGLRLASRWIAASAGEQEMAVAEPVWLAVLTVLGMALVLVGIVPVVKVVVRKPLFIASVLLVGVLAWQVSTGSIAGATGNAGGSFWEGVQLTVEAAVVFLPFVEALARRLHDDEVAMSSFAVGYAVPATLMFAAGAFLAYESDNLADLGAGAIGAAGVAVLIAWVVIAEVDQAFAGFVSAGAEAIGVLKV